MSKVITSITALPLDEIHTDGRLRPVGQAGVDALKTSIRDLGVLQDPIHVRKIKRSGKILLMAGGHRLEAFRQLRDEGDAEFASIPVTCWECNDSFARMMEIDDNLAGAELTALDNAVFLAARKELYEAMHPEAKAATGADLVNKRWNTADTMSTVSFAATTAQKFGLSERQIRRMTSAGAALMGADVNALRGAPAPVTLNDLTTIAKISDPEERRYVVAALSEGKAKNATKARANYSASQGTAAPLLSDHDQKLSRLRDAWDRGGPRVRTAFVEEYADELRALLGEGAEVNQAGGDT
jgi:ParB family chromosome partitioning protein